MEKGGGEPGSPCGGDDDKKSGPIYLPQPRSVNKPSRIGPLQAALKLRMRSTRSATGRRYRERRKLRREELEQKIQELRREFDFLSLSLEFPEQSQTQQLRKETKFWNFKRKSLLDFASLPEILQKPLQKKQKLVLKLEVQDEEDKRRIFRKVIDLAGVDSVALDMKEKKLTVKGVMIKPSQLMSRLRDHCPKIVSVGVAKEEEEETMKNHDLMAIPSRFFQLMSLLQILDLSYTRIKSLPESIFRLVSLRELLLIGCELMRELSPQVGQLQNLEKLDLDQTHILKLPETVGNLTKLKFLRVSFYKYENQNKEELLHQTIICPRIISSLLNLTVLSIDVDPDDERWDEIAAAIVEETFILQKLSFLRLYLPNLEVLWEANMVDPFMGYYLLPHFRITVGHHKDRLISRVPREVEALFEGWAKCFKFINGRDISTKLKDCLRGVTSFFLDSHVSAQSLLDFGFENIMQLKFCIVAECHDMWTVFDFKKPFSKVTVSLHLQYLAVYYAKNLKSILSSSTNDSCNYTLSNLRILALHRCPILSVILSDSMHNLEELMIEDCPQVTSIFISRDEGSQNFASEKPRYQLPTLKRMSLLFLPKLERISDGLMMAPMLEKVGIYYCPQLRNMSSIETQVERLDIKGEVTWWNVLEWEKQQVPGHIQFSEFKKKRDLITQLVDEKFIVLEYGEGFNQTYPGGNRS